MTISPLLPSTFLLKRVYEYAVSHQPFSLILVPHADEHARHAYFAGTRGTIAELIRTNVAEQEDPVYGVITLPANIMTSEEDTRKLIMQAIDDDAWNTEESP